MSIEIVSNAPNPEGGENYNNEFTMRLPECIDAENVTKTIQGLTITYPLTIENVGEKTCGISLMFAFKNYNILNYYATFEYHVDMMYVPSGCYTLEKLIATLNNLISEYDVKFELLDGGRVCMKWNAPLVYGRRDKNVDNGNTIIRKFYYPKGYPFTFRFELTPQLRYMFGFQEYDVHKDIIDYAKKYKITLDNATKIKLINFFLVKRINSYTRRVRNDIQWISGKHIPDITNGVSKMYIYCDEVAPSTVGNTKSRILGSLQINMKRMGSGELYTETLHGIKYELIKARIHNLHINIRDTTDTPIHFSAGTVSIKALIE